MRTGRAMSLSSESSSFRYWAQSVDFIEMPRRPKFEAMRI